MREAVTGSEGKGEREPPSLAEAARLCVRVARLIRPYWGRLVRGIALGAMASLLGMVPPLFAKAYFDVVYPSRDVELLRVLVLAAAGLAGAAAVIGALRTYYSQAVSSLLGSAVALMYFNHLQHLPLRFFEERRVGEIMSRLGDMRAALGLVTRVLQTLVANGLYLLLVPPVLLALNWRLAVLALVTTPATAAVAAGASWYARRHALDSAVAAATLGAQQFETLSQIRLVKTLAAERTTYRRAHEMSEEALRTQLRAAAIRSAASVVNGVLRALGAALSAWYAWTMVIGGRLSLGEFVAFTAYVGYLVGPVNQVAGLMTDFQQSSVAVARAFEYLDQAPESSPERVSEETEGRVLGLSGAVTLRDVGMRYRRGETNLSPSLTGVHLALAPGTATALVGVSGAGKSTLLRVLGGLERPTTGELLFDGRDAASMELSEIRTHVALVSQEVALLKGSLLDNLTFGLGAVERDRVARVLELCHLSEVVAQLPGGLDSEIAEWGVSLSGGQRQRVTLARALLRGSPVLALDEATSQVDAAMEIDVMRAVLTHARQQTVVFATHRLAAALLADRICVMEDGRIVATGTHHELLRTSATYARLAEAAGVTREAGHRRMASVS